MKRQSPSHRHPRFFRSATIVGVVAWIFHAALPLSAAETTWNGGGDGISWSDAANWGGTAPAAEDSLQFGGPTGGTTTNDYTPGTRFDGISFLADAGPFVLTGNSIGLMGNITSAALGTQTINLDIQLLGDALVRISANDTTSRIALGGSISGDYGLTLSGTEPYGYNRVTLSGSNSYSGTTTVGVAGNPVTGWITDPGALPGAVTVVDGSTLRLRPAVTGSTFSNNISISGNGSDSLERASWASRQGAGALVVNNGANVTGTVTLLGNSRISANRADGSGDNGTISGKITGPYALQFGFEQERPGTLTISNPGNDWTGDTVVTGGGSSNSSGRVFTLQLGAANVIPHGTGYGNFTIRTNNTRVNSMGNDQNVNGFFGNDAAASYTGGGTLTVGNGDADGNYLGVLTVTQLVKTGTGTQILRGNSTISGGVTVNAGTLTLSGGYLAGGAITVDSEASFVLAGGQLRYTSTTDFSGPFTFTNGTLAGTNWKGSLSGQTIGSGQIISPGTSPGAATTGNQTWAPGGAYRFEINDAEGVQGTNWDHLTVTGELNIADLSAENPFTVQLVSLTPTDAAGEVINFDSTQPYSWTLASFGTLNGTFSPDLVQVDTAGFANDFTGGGFSVARDGDNLVLNYIPEPGMIGLLAAGALLLRARRRRV